MTRGVVAEWEEQEAVILAFASQNSDWDYCLDDVRKCICKIACTLVETTKVIMLCEDNKELALYLEIDDRIKVVEVDFDDTWMRDCNILSIFDGQEIKYRGFEFNGWGGKYAFDKDNKLNTVLEKKGIYSSFEAINYILEGGAIESDGQGTILTTSSCVLNGNRNTKHTQAEVEMDLKSYLDAQQVLFLEHGYLVGDDTDGHIDTLARFCNENTIVYVGLPSKDDEHYENMLAMKKQLETFTNVDGKPYTLVELPFVKAKYDEGERLPATYANFLISNGQVLVPLYGCGTDEKALEILQTVFSNYKVMGINCEVLIREHGSLHCMTMQIAKKLSS